MKNRNVVLIGFMGTGKSTVGRLLSERLGWAFVDTDKVIELREGTAIPVLFAERGEAYFRQVEKEAVQTVLRGDSQVVSTGGGAVLAPENREAMLACGFVVALTASPESIVERVQADADRPLLAGDPKRRVEELLEQRKLAYDFAHFKIDTTRLTPEDIVSIILENTKEAASQPPHS